MLIDLKKEINEYLKWADAKFKAGANEVTLFSTVNLHIFQTCYDRLRPTADMSKWMYGDYDLVSQFIKDGQDLKPWLEKQGALFVEDTQATQTAPSVIAKRMKTASTSPIPMILMVLNSPFV